MMKLNKLIGSTTAKVAAMAIAFGCAFGAWADTVAKIVETGAEYDSVTAAVTAASDGQTVQLSNLAILTENMVVGDNKAITLDLNGNTIYTASNPNDPSTLHNIQIHTGASLTISNPDGSYGGGIINQAAQDAVIVVKGTLIVNIGTAYENCKIENQSTGNTVQVNSTGRVIVNKGGITAETGNAV